MLKYAPPISSLFGAFYHEEVFKLIKGLLKISINIILL